MAKALAIIDKQVTVVNGKYVSAAQDGITLGISQRVFDYFMNSMNTTNEKLDKKEFVIYKNHLILANYNQSAISSGSMVNDLLLVNIHAPAMCFRITGMGTLFH